MIQTMTKRGTREPDPYIVTKCRLEQWGQWAKDRTDLGLPHESAYTKGRTSHSAVYFGEDEPPEVREVSEAIKQLTDRRRLIVVRYYAWRLHKKEIAALENVSRQRMDELFADAVFHVERLLQALPMQSGISKAG